MLLNASNTLTAVQVCGSKIIPSCSF